jgi:hypothetical protein
MELTPELAEYVRQMAGLFRGTRTLMSGIGFTKAREAGEKIYARHGHRAMVTVCDAVRAEAGGVAARELEITWDGIGEWQQ